MKPQEQALKAKIWKKPPSGKPKSQRKLIPSIQEKCNILQDKMLTVESINLAQVLLVKQFPGISGLMDTSLRKMHQFEIIPVDKLYIQLLHAGSMHWVCISNLETNKDESGTHYVYDILCKQKIMLNIVKQIVSCPYYDKSTMSLPPRSVQQQKNGIDCGLFSVAFATTLTFDGNPSTVNYDAALLIAHLIKCFHDHFFSFFLLQKFYIVFYSSYVNICKDLQKTIVL